MAGTTKNGYLVKHGTDNPYAPKTKTSLVDDIAKGKALSQTLIDTPDREALGYAPFSTVTDYTAGQIVYYNNKLWKFTTDKVAGAWDANKVEQYDIKTAIEESGKVDELKEQLENGDVVPALAENLGPWADQKAIATPDTYSDAVRTTGGDIPIETSAGSKLESIKPVAGSKWTAKLLFNGSYNMLNAAKWADINNQPYVGGSNQTFVYFLVPKLTLGTFGTADENNGLLFTDKDGINVQPTSVYFKPLGSTVPQSLTDGTSITPTSVSYDGNTYKTYETSGAGWLIVPKTIYDNDVCAHIAWEDWYDKYVSLDEPATNPEAVVGILMLEGLLALVHSDKYLRGVNDEVCDNVVFSETSATITHMVDELSVAAASWTNSTTGESDSQGNALYRHSATVSGIKQGGAACVEGEDGGIPLTVNGTTVSYIDTNAAAPASVVFYEVTSVSTTKAYTDSVFNGSNINTETGVLPINDCSIEAQVAMDGEANITVKYAKNIVDQVAINATVDVPQIKEQVEEHEERITELEDTAVRTNSYDASLSVGLADNLRGDTVVNAKFYKRKTGGTQSVGSSIASIKEVRGKSLVWNQILQQSKYVDMGLPSGNLWATCNIDVTQPDGFATSPFQYECSFFSWGNVDGHNPINNWNFDYDWGSSPTGQPYVDTTGYSISGNIPVNNSYDAARHSARTIWRIPSCNDIKELFTNSEYIDANGDIITGSNKLITINGVVGIYLKSKINNNTIFFPACGFGNSGSSWQSKGTVGNYYSSTNYTVASAYGLFFNNGTIDINNTGYRNIGKPIRPILVKTTIPENGENGHKFGQYQKNLTDFTLMFGAGNEPSTVSEFEKMFPLDYYDYNAGEVIPFAGQNLTTIGKNQYNPATGKANLLGGQTYQINGTYTSATIDGVAVTLDSNDCFTTTKDCVLDVTGGNDTDTFVGLYNGETNTFEPYEKHTLPLDPSQWRDKQGNLVFPYGGMHGADNGYDYAKVDADGYIRKVVRCFSQVDLSSLSWGRDNADGHSFKSGVLSNTTPPSTNRTNVICSKYVPIKVSNIASFANKTCIMLYNDKRLYIHDEQYENDTTAHIATFKTAMQGVMLYYPLDEPVEVELATPVYAKYLVDKDGTEEITPANGTAPYTTMANFSILYAMDARGEIKGLPKNYLSKESAENMLNAMVTAGIIASYTMTWDAANSRYAFVITAPEEPEENTQS